MTGDWVFDACVVSLILAIISVGVLIGFIWGYGRGVRWQLRRGKNELNEQWAANGWKYTEQKR